MSGTSTNYDGIVTQRDSAFLWETEALRTTGRARRSTAEQSSRLLAGGDWLTLKEASDITGVPTNTIRKWARHDNIPSYLEKTEDGHLRIVSLEGIRLWASEVGRELQWSDEDEDVVVDLTPEQTAETDPDPEPQAPAAEVPEGSMLVPLDAWNKMLNQLGNLHEAGQQLAEARERAAKAETEARFLKERLAEMRSELEKAREAEIQSGPEEEGEREATVPQTMTTLGGTAASLARKLYEGLRDRWS